MGWVVNISGQLGVFLRGYRKLLGKTSLEEKLRQISQMLLAHQALCLSGRVSHVTWFSSKFPFYPVPPYRIEKSRAGWDVRTLSPAFCFTDEETELSRSGNWVTQESLSSNTSLTSPIWFQEPCIFWMQWKVFFFILSLTPLLCFSYTLLKWVPVFLIHEFAFFIRLPTIHIATKYPCRKYRLLLPVFNIYTNGVIVYLLSSILLFSFNI